ncbi:hypothetical protein [Micromonospora chersina]|uniref:hypothetical protein n=1 Tax=Micromonospora chersina TaxID=47854 RepID=UPI00371AAD85
MTATGARCDRVRVGKFDWQRLLLLSPLPVPTRWILMVLSVYMSEDGGNARPGLDNLSLVSGRGRRQCIDHLGAAVEAGYLEQVERGGYRGVHHGRRASVYAATVPKAIYADAGRLLSLPPFRRADSGGATHRTFTVPGIRGEGATGRTFGHSEGAVSRSEGAAGRSEGAAARTPSISSSSNNSHQSPRASDSVDAASVIRAAGGRDDEIDEVIEKIKTGSNKPVVNLIGYVKTLAANRHLQPLIDAVRADRAAASQRQAELVLPDHAYHDYLPSPSGDYCSADGCEFPEAHRRHHRPKTAA